jgi:site-specific DNA-cytosine methylase
MGYDAEWGVLGAADVGAKHQRDRIWIVGKATDSTGIRPQKQANECILESKRWNEFQSCKPRNTGEMETKQRDILSHTKHNRVGWGKQQSESTKETDSRHTIRELADTDLCRHLHGQTEINSTVGEFDALGEFGTSSENVANSDLSGFASCNQPTLRPKQQVLEKQSWGSCDEHGEISNTNGIGQSRHGSHGKSIGQETIRDRQASIIGPIGESNFWSFEPNVGRVVDGMASRVDRLKAIGNGQVPLCAATAWTILMERINGL